MAGIAALAPLEQSVLNVDMNSLRMAPWDAGGTFRIGSRPEVAIRRDILCCVVQYFGGLAGTCVIDLYAGVSTTPVEMLVEDKTPNFLEITSEDSCGRRYGYSPGGDSKTALGFPRVSCSPVEMCAVDSNFLRASFPPGELCAERQDCVRPGLWNDFMIDATPVTGSLIYSAGPDGPSVTGGPVGQPGTLSPSTFVSAILVEPGVGNL